MDGMCELAPRGELKAYFVASDSDGGDVWILATGETSTPCWDVAVDQSPLDIWPPQFAVNACPTGGLCPQVVTPYSAVSRFRVGSRPEEIQVTDADGPRNVRVDDAPGEVATFGAPAGTVVGYSRPPISLEEAIGRAVSQIPRPHPNVGVSMTVDKIWYTDGGIVGPVLYVRGKAGT